ncbi:hypothetical protein GCM10011321_09350 [Youhaiella tibetensis]|nr:hypothetical protein GCM10011321_09350 [Youhaiella tibetensis]
MLGSQIGAELFRRSDGPDAETLILEIVDQHVSNARLVIDDDDVSAFRWRSHCLAVPIEIAGPLRSAFLTN